MKMYKPVDFDTLLDFSIKDEEEIICRGRGRYTERIVPRLPHAAYIIKKQNENKDHVTGRKRHGRGRACILNPKTLDPEAVEFRPKTSNYEVSNHKPRPFTAGLDMIENFHSSHSDGEVIGSSFQPMERSSHADRLFHAKHHSADPLIPGNGEYTSDMATSIVQLTKAEREKEKYNHKVNFAEINRQMLQELAGHIQNNAGFKKPIKVMSLTKANLDKHVRDTESELKQSVSMYSSSIDNASDNEVPIYVKYGVTHEDIWLYKQNRFKPPQAVKNKIKEFNQTGQMTEVQNGHVAEKQNGLESIRNETHGENMPSMESEHEKQVSYLKLLYDEDSWSNQKEISVSSEEKVVNDCQVPDANSENNIEIIDQKCSVSVNCSADNDDIQNKIKNSVAEKETKNSEQTKISETMQDPENHKQAVDVAVDSMNLDRLSFNGHTSSVSDPIESDEKSLTITDDIDLTVKQEAQDISEKQVTLTKNIENNHLSADNCVDTVRKEEEVEDSTTGCKHVSVDGVLDKTGEGIDLEQQVSENIDSKRDNETFLCKSINCDDSGLPANEKKKEILTQGKTQVVGKKVTRNSCTIAQLDDFTLPGDKEIKLDIPVVNGIEDKCVSKVEDECEGKVDGIEKFKVIKKKCNRKKSESPKVVDESVPSVDEKCEDNTERFQVFTKKGNKKKSASSGIESESGAKEDDMEGFQVVRKKRSKKKSLSPPAKQRKNKLKPDNTVWKLYGKNVIQVDGLPLDCDIRALCSLVSSFGAVQDYQDRVIDMNCSVRFRLPDEDSCDYAVTCLDNTETLHGENCIVSCFKLSN